MTKEILINSEEKEKRIAILNNNKLEDFFIEHPEDKTIVGNIYKGRVEDVVPSVGAAFVNMGLEKNGFLYLTDVEDCNISGEELEQQRPRKQTQRPRLELKRKQEILVQVTKEPFASKGARLTSHISIPGRYLVLMPLDRHFGISRKIDDSAERRRIVEIIDSLKIKNNYGLVVRTVAWGKEKKAIVRDLHFLMNLWDKIQRNAARRPAPYLLYEDYDLVLRTVRDYFGEDSDKLYVDSKIEYKRIYKFVGAFLRPLLKHINFYRQPTPLFEKRGVEKEVGHIFDKKIYVACGGYIVIEQTEGLIVVDVNSGGFNQKKLRQEDAAFIVNSEAAVAIARQLRLRDLSGIIVIDFIDMQREGNRRKLLTILKKALSEDKAKTDVIGISRLGLIQLTRERVRRSLESLSYKDCPYCGGKGKVKSEVSMVGEVIRYLRSNLSNCKQRVATVFLHPSVSQKILSENRASIKMLERRFRKKIMISSDETLHIEQIRMF